MNLPVMDNNNKPQIKYVLNCADYLFEESPEKRGFLFNQRSGEMFTLNGTAAHIVKYLQQEATFSDLVESVSLEFGKPTDAVEEDVQSFLEDLVAKTIVLVL